ncbi:MAG: flagellin, partial [Thermoguttaceae bacterium]
AVMTGGIKAAEDNPKGYVISANGVNAMFEVVAKKNDSHFEGTQVLVVADPAGPKISFDPQSKQISIGIDPANPPTARQIVDLLNLTPQISELFQARIPATAPGTSIVPTGNDRIALGDSGTLRIAKSDVALGASMQGNTDSAHLGLTFYSVEYGSKEFVSVLPAQGTDFPLTDRFGNVTEMAKGTDVVAKINDQMGIGTGRIVSMATSDLDLSIWLDPNVRSGDVIGFRVTGGGALIQLGPDAVPDQQARIALKNVHSISLGGVNGHLSQLRTGGAFDLKSDVFRAAKIVDEVSNIVSTMRGRIGAFQKTQIEANMENMTDAIEIESGAHSELADTDFAAESSNMARLQLLAQTNISVLQQTNQMAQMLLGLLQR